MDSTMAAAEADRVASAAEQNLLLSLKNCLDVVHKTQWMLELDPKCNCVNSYNNDGESKWKRRREVEKAAYSIEVVLCKSLTEIETKFPESDYDMFVVMPKPKRPAVVGDVLLYWCERMCVYEKVMDSIMWCTTPSTIMELVFARLPLGQIFQMRGLSKHWRGSIMSPSFQHAFGTTTSSRFAFISGLTRRRIWSYGIRERKWYTLQFEFPPIYGDFFPVAADGGLLCCLCPPAIPTKGIHDLELYVCNPLTQAWRKLPLPSRVQRFDLIHMVTDTQTKSSKIIMEVYNSATNTWNASSKGVF